MDQDAAPGFTNATAAVTTEPSAPPSADVQSTTGGAQPGGSIISDLLRTLGVGQSHVDEVHQQTQGADVHKQIDQARAYVTESFNHAREQAQKNPGAVLAGLSALVIAAGMMRNRNR